MALNPNFGLVLQKKMFMKYSGFTALFFIFLWLSISFLPSHSSLSISHLVWQAFEQSGAKQALVFVHKHAPINSFLTDLRTLGMRVVALHEVQSNPEYIESVKEFTDDFQKGDIEVSSSVLFAPISPA